MERFDDLFGALAAPFSRQEEKSRTQSGQTFRYVKPRTIENRLDNVLGCGNWWDDSWPANDGTGAYVCHLTIRLPDGTTVTKVGVGAPGGEGSRAHPAKTAESDSFKRAAVKFGIGRYLYGEGVADHRPQQAAQEPPRELTKAEKLLGWCECRGHVQRLQALARSNYNKDPIQLTDEQSQALWKLLEGATKQSPKPEHANGTNENGNPQNFGWPRSGAALYAWAKNLEGAFKTAIVRSIDEQFGERSRFGWPRSYKEWTPDQVEQAAVYVARIIKTFPGYDGQFDGKVPDVSKIRDELRIKADQLCKALGSPTPTEGEMIQCIHLHSGEIAEQFGGEMITSFETCEDARLLQGCLVAIEKDLEESKDFNF